MNLGTGYGREIKKRKFTRHAWWKIDLIIKKLLRGTLPIRENWEDYVKVNIRITIYTIEDSSRRKDGWKRIYLKIWSVSMTENLKSRNIRYGEASIIGFLKSSSIRDTTIVGVQRTEETLKNKGTWRNFVDAAMDLN